MAGGQGVGRGLLQSMAALAILFSLASVVLYFCGMGFTTWSVATEPEGLANGELGLYHFCPNTAIALSPNVSDFLNITSIPTSCAYVDYNCRVALGTTRATAFGTAYTIRVYNIFDPRPYSFDDRMYELIRAFPGPGSCRAYTTSRVFGGMAAFAAFVAFLTAPFGLCAPARRGSTGGTGSGCVCLAFTFGIVAISVWAASVINWDTSQYGSAYWCMLSAVVLGAASIPCLGAFALAPSSDPAYQGSPPSAPPVAANHHYQPGQTPPAAQHHHPEAP